MAQESQKRRRAKTVVCGGNSHKLFAGLVTVSLYLEHSAGLFAGGCV